MKTLKFRGQNFQIREFGEYVYLYPPEGVETRKHLDCFSPTDEQMSDALGYEVIFVDYTGLIDCYLKVT